MRYTPDPQGFHELLPGIRLKTLVYGEHTLLCEIHLAKGALLPEHHHPEEQSGYLVSGALRFFGPAGEAVVRPGAAWTFTSNVPHGAEALDDSVAVEVFSPVRESYLPYAAVDSREDSSP